MYSSKYVQSDTNNSFKLAKLDLENGKTVLFSGTPCQIAGLKSFLRKEYENLYTIDLICHGTPSQLILEKYNLVSLIILLVLLQVLYLELLVV
jgi:coenzyme F420-reducing hydrogenase beta subunit